MSRRLSKIQKTTTTILLTIFCVQIFFPVAFADTQETILVDNFFLAEDDGTPLWDLIPGWVEGGSADDFTSIVEDNPLDTSPTPYQARLRNGGYITRSFSETETYRDIQLHYFWRGYSDAVATGGILQVYWKKTADDTFLLLDSHDIANVDTWSDEVTIMLPPEANGQNIDIKFIVDSDDILKEARIEDVSLSGVLIDTVAPIIAENQSVTTLDGYINNRFPFMKIQTTEPGTLQMTGFCRTKAINDDEGNVSQVIFGINTITLKYEEEVGSSHPPKIDDIGSFPDAYYPDCVATVTDANGNISDPLPLTPFFIDATPPIITIIPYNTAHTRNDVIVTASIDNNGILDSLSHTFTANGSYTFEATDEHGNTATKTVTVTNIDKTPPQITLIGAVSVDVPFGSVYVDQGATCVDNVDSACEVTIDDSLVDTDHKGTYTVTYMVTDSVGNIAEQVTRTVHVVDTTKPIITLLGNATVTVAQGSTYTDAGATAQDDVDGDITDNIITTILTRVEVFVPAVDTSLPGTYTITYDVSDAAGHEATPVTRTVIVTDNTPPHLSETTPVVSPATTRTPHYTFTTDEAGTITYGGDCHSSTSEAVVGENTIIFDTLTDGNHSSCTVTITDESGNVSTPLTISPFTVDTNVAVSDVTTTNLSPTSTSVIWTTNKMAQTIVEYGTSMTYGSSTTIDILSTSHSTTLTGLTPSTTYHFRFVSTDSFGNVTTSEDGIFTTSSLPKETKNDGGTSGGGLIFVVPTTPEKPIFVPLPTPSTEPVEEKPITPENPPINPPVRPIPRPVVDIPVQTPNIPQPTDDRGGGVTTENNTITSQPVDAPSKPVDIGGGVVPEERSNLLFWAFISALAMLNIWWFYLRKNDGEEEQMHIIKIK